MIWRVASQHVTAPTQNHFRGNHVSWITTRGECVSLDQSGVQVGSHPSQVMVEGEAASARAFGEEDLLLGARVKGELERDGSRERLTGVRDG